MVVYDVIRQYVFVDGFVYKVCRGNYLNFVGFNIGFRDNVFYVIIVVGVVVSVDNGNNWFLWMMLEVKVKCGFCGRWCYQWVDNNNVFFVFNECNVRDILVVYLIYFIGDFEQVRNIVDL